MKIFDRFKKIKISDRERKNPLSTDGILSYRDFNHVQEKIKTNEPTKIAMMIAKFKLKFQSLDLSVKNLSKKIKNTLSLRVILNLIQSLSRTRFGNLRRFRIGSGMTQYRASFKNFKQEFKTFLKDHFSLLTKSSAENHLRIQKCKKIKAGEACNLSFDSYSELKRYQKKVRILTYSSSSIFSIALVALVGMQIFFSSTSQGATFNFQQASWTT